jgi:hypothetical protein
MVINIFRTDCSTIKRFGFFKYDELPYIDDVTAWCKEGEYGVGFICFFFGISVGLSYGDC